MRLALALSLFVFAVGCKEKDKEAEPSSSKRAKTASDATATNGGGGSTGAGAASGKQEKGDGKSSSGSSARLFSPSDLKSKFALRKYGEDEIESEVGFISGVENHDPEAEASTDDCFDETFGASKVQATANSLRVDTEIDLSPCLKKVFAADAKYKKVKVTQYLVRFQGVTLCDGDAGLAEFDGKTFKEFSSSKRYKDNALCGEMGFTSYNLVKTESDYSMEHEGELTTALSISYSGSWDDGKPCRTDVVKGETKVESCMEFDYMDDLHKKQSDVRKLLLKGLKAKPLDQYYSKGSAELTVNDWTGTMTYKSADVGPTWKLSRDGKSAEGTYGAKKDGAGLALDNTPATRGLPALKWRLTP